MDNRKGHRRARTPGGAPAAGRSDRREAGRKSVRRVTALLAATATAVLSAGAPAQTQRKVPESPPGPESRIRVVVVSTADCTNTPPTMRLIEETARELGLAVDISRQIVTTQDEAERYRFIGSPTVQVDGLDLQPEMRKNPRFGFT